MVRMHESNGLHKQKQCFSHLKAVFHMIDYWDDTNNTLFFIRLK